MRKMVTREFIFILENNLIYLKLEDMYLFKILGNLTLSLISLSCFPPKFQTAK